MFKARQWIIFSACSFLLLNCNHTHAADDPWNPNRKFGGRLLILIAGAGEFIPASFKAQNPEVMDTVSKYTYAHFLQFRRTDPRSLPAYSIVMASDPRLTAKLEKLPQRIKDESGFLGTIPASIDSFNNLLFAEGKISRLQQAIDNFSKEKRCQDLMASEGYGSVLPLLKVEIIVITQNSSGDIPVWDNASDSGSFEQWKRFSGKMVLNRDLIARLRSRLGEALVQTFVTSCNGADIGEHFQMETQCSCFLSVTDEATLFWVNGSRTPPFAPSIPDPGAGMGILKAQSRGAPNVASMGAISFRHFEYYRTRSPDKISFDPVFAGNVRDNPLQSFLYSSADARAEMILRHFAKRLHDDSPKKLLAAGFSESLPPKLNVSETAMNEPLLRRVFDATQSLRRNGYAEYLREPKLQLDSTFATAMRTFRKCLSKKHPDPRCCNSIDKVLDAAVAGKGVGGAQTNADRSVLDASNKFFEDYDSSKADTLVSQYNEGAITISALFAKLNSLWDEFDTFREEITSYADDHYNKQLPPDLEAAFKIMKTNYQDAFFVAQLQFFPLLRKETLEVRLARIEEAAKLLSLHEDDLKGPDPKEALRQLGNDLVCLTAFPVGPAFDEKYGKN